jgi:hypothetical protein
MRLLPTLQSLPTALAGRLASLLFHGMKKIGLRIPPDFRKKGKRKMQGNFKKLNPKRKSGHPASWVA